MLDIMQTSSESNTQAYLKGILCYEIFLHLLVFQN